MIRDWIGPGFFIGFAVTGFLWMLGDWSITRNQIERDFREACAKVNGTAVWNNKYWECLK